jgi:hypothetical protein
MRARGWYVAAVAALFGVGTSMMPAYAGWGADLGRSVVSSIVRQAANRLVNRALNSGYLPPSQPSYRPDNYSNNFVPQQYEPYRQQPVHHSSSPPRHTPPTAHKTVTASAKPSLAYPKDKGFIPPPPPYPTVYPGGKDTTIASMKESTGKSDNLVPPPPPAPSVWDDATPVSDASVHPIIEPPTPVAKPHADIIKAQAPLPKPAPDFRRTH